MSLTGHLDVIPLEEVLRLLARSYKTGCLRVDAADLHGRIYLSSGSLSLATTGTDDDLRRQLLASGTITEEGLRSADLGGRPLTHMLTGGSQALVELIREEVVESLYRIRKPGRGQFVFNVDMAPRYQTGQAFDVEMCVAEADRRAAEWADIESVLSSIDLPVRMAPEIPEQVNLQASTWRLLAAFEGRATVRALSERLGLSAFRVAKEVSNLLRGGLVEMIEVVAPAPLVPQTPAPVRQPAPEPEPEPDVYNRSWWMEPEQEPAPSEPEPAPVLEESSNGSSLPDRFLEQVFSQLEAPEPPTPPQDQPTYGFLKRRRMSSLAPEEDR